MQCERRDPHDTWHVVVLRDDGRVFALTAEADTDTHAEAQANAMTWKLPAVRVPHGSRVVPLVASALARDYGLDVFCLTHLRDGRDGRDCGDDRTGARTMLAELCDRPRALPSHARWIDPADLHTPSTSTYKEPLGVIIDARARSGRDTERPGFWDRLRRWVDTVLETDANPDGTPRFVSGAKTQWNAGHGFSLVRLETSGAAVWFKSTGSPNEAECLVTGRIAERHAQHSPRLLACHESWHGWLTEEVSGPSLRHARARAGVDADTDVWMQTAADIARLQVDECYRVDDWLQSGCADLRVETLASKVDEFFNGMVPIFDRQVKTSPPRLLRADLAITADALRRAFEIAARVPDTLVHADLNPDNVFFRDARAVFLDWAGAFVGSPFIALENLCGHLRRCHAADGVTNDDLEREIRKVREAYAAVWRDARGTGMGTGTGAALVHEALSVAPMVRYATLAMRSAGWLWHSARETATPSTPREPLLRSLTRSMHQAAISAPALSPSAPGQSVHALLRS